MRTLTATVWVTLLALATGGAALAADALKVLHSFGVGGQQGGNNLYGGLTLDAAGNLYGVAEAGGRYGFGTVFELSPQSNGTWTEKVLYSFKGGQDGASPHATLAWDSAGNLYGTTVGGGGSTSCGGGCGTVFQLSSAPGEWTETVLYRFAGPDGRVPYAGVTVDNAGNVYGATTGGGAAALGTVYQLTPGPGGTWVYNLIHSFTGKPDGFTPYGTPILDSAGNLYGTTFGGGTSNKGTVYQIAPAQGGGWSERVLYSFKGGADGVNPMSALTSRNGRLYGVTEMGGTANCGTAFRLIPNQGGGWTETVLHTFLGVTAQDGENPNALIFDTHGNLFGTSMGGGVDNPGTIFEMSPKTDGSWTETVLYSFLAGLDGAYPTAGLVMDASGNLYGTTLWGGPAGDTTGGVAFEYVP